MPIVIPPKSLLQYGQSYCIHKMQDALDLGRIHRYSGLTMEDIRATIQTLPNTDLMLVDVTSPIIYVMRRNQERLEINLKGIQTVDDKYYIVAQDIAQLIMRELDEGYFRKSPLSDFGSMTAEIVRADGKGWYDVSNLTMLDEQRVAQYIIRKPFQINMLVEATYALVSNVMHDHDAVEEIVEEVEEQGE